MKPLHSLILVGLTTLIVIASAEGAHGCMRAESYTPLCAEYTRAKAVFTGVIHSIKLEGRGDSTIRRVRFKVGEVFKGTLPATQDILTSHNSSCDFQIKRGERWIVFARAEESGEMAIASLWRPFKGNDQDLAYLRGRDRAAPPAIKGTLHRMDGITPNAGLEIQVFTGGREIATRTDEKGRFTVTVPRAGEYVVRVKVPYKAFSSAYNLDITDRFENGWTLMEYKVTVALGECHYTEFDVVPSPPSANPD